MVDLLGLKILHFDILSDLSKNVNHKTSLSPPVRNIFTDHSKEVLLSWIIFVIYVSCLSCFLVCSLQHFVHVLGKG